MEQVGRRELHAHQDIRDQGGENDGDDDQLAVDDLF
jgi:hypothetical protein